MKNTLLPEFYIRFRRVFCFILTINCVKYSPPIEAGASFLHLRGGGLLAHLG